MISRDKKKFLVQSVNKELQVLAVKIAAGNYNVHVPEALRIHGNKCFKARTLRIRNGQDSHRITDLPRTMLSKMQRVPFFYTFYDIAEYCRQDIQEVTPPEFSHEIVFCEIKT